VDAILGLDAVLRGQYDAAAERLTQVVADTRRLQLRNLTL